MQNLAGVHGPHAALECHVCLCSHPSADSAVLDDLQVFGVRRGPTKTCAPLAIHADAVLPGTVTLQCSEVIAGR